MMKILLILGVVLTACETQEINQSSITKNQGEEVIVENSTNTGVVLTERLLPSGLIEIGDREAPNVLLVFTEHHCRYCKEFYADLFPKLKQDFIDSGMLRLQIGIVPLKKYPDSQRAGIGLLCAVQQEKALDMHRLLFEIGAKDRQTLVSEAVTLDLDVKLFEECIDSPDTAYTMQRQASLARSLNVTLVPTFFLNGQKSIGLPYYEDLKTMIEEESMPL